MATDRSEFLIFMVLAAVLAVFFLLYFNRVFASIVSYAIRTWTWHRFGVYIDVKSLQISLLGGRVFFTGLRYHGHNETFFVQHGHITWRYWLRRVRAAEIFASDHLAAKHVSSSTKNASLPCRINVNLTGLEWFVYNRSPAYDSILDGLTEEASNSRSSFVSNEKQFMKPEPNSQSRGQSRRRSSGDFRARRRDGSALVNDVVPSDKDAADEESKADKSIGSRPSTRTACSSGDAPTKPELPFVLQLFPIHVDCQKAAAVIGNDNTKAITIVKSGSVDADIDASSTNAPDPYRQLFKIRFHHPVIELRDNEDFQEDQVELATKEIETVQETEPVSKTTFFRHQRHRVANTLRNLVPSWRRSVESFSIGSRPNLTVTGSRGPRSQPWQGLSRYLDDYDQDDKSRWSSVEYAAEPLILDSKEAFLTVYWDVVGQVSSHASVRHSTNINGDKAPAWGMNLSVKGGTMNYGPWADRLRADLQRVFFPSLAKDASPARRLLAGAWRVATQFELLVELDEPVTVRIPMKENSKNWRWRGKEPRIDHNRQPDKRRQTNRGRKSTAGDVKSVRTAGWLEIKAPANSSVKYTMDMVASNHGYNNYLNIDLPSTEVWSSVNHDMLWKSGKQTVSCDLSNPLSWNGLRNWHFNVDCEDLDLYILRDHVFLLVDLIDDWSSGPSAEYLAFVPYKYHIDLNLKNVQLLLNVNDSNVIDKATALEENSYLIFSSPLLAVTTTIPIEKYRPRKNAIPFNVKAETLDLSLNAPLSNTLSAFLSSKDLGHIDGFTLNGSYQYHTTTSPANTDTVILNLHAQSAYAYLFGFVLRCFLLLKDNYFGDHVHFRTLDEYQEQLKLARQGAGVELDQRPRNKKSNDLDVMLGIQVDDPQVMLPTNLYSADRFVLCEMASLIVDLRFTNYYMDLELDISPLNMSLGSRDGGSGSPDMAQRNAQLFVDGVRVYGHRLFGLPPSEPTYLCNWDVSVGAITGECTSEFLSSLAKGGASFAFHFDDVENALVTYSSLVFHDITFSRLCVSAIRLWLNIDEAAFLFSTGTIELNMNDWARSHYSKRTNIHIPNLEMACVHRDNESRQRLRNRVLLKPDAFLKADVHIAQIGRKFKFSEERSLQQELVSREDQRTHRTPFLILPEFVRDFTPEQVDHPAQCAPVPPEPVQEMVVDDGSSFSQNKSSRSSSSSSFLSSGSITQSSRRRQPSLMRQKRRRREVFNEPGSSKDPSQQKQYYPSVSFSSQFYAPHFQFQDAQIDTGEACPQSDGEGDRVPPEDDDFFSQAATSLEDIESDQFRENTIYSSMLFEFVYGIDGFMSPRAVRHVSTLASALELESPEDVVDSIQVKTMRKIFNYKKQSNIEGKVSDILIKLPRANLRFVDASSPQSSGSSREEQDQYDMQLSKFAVVTRTTTDNNGKANTENVAPRTSFHLRSGSAELSASERLSSQEKPQAAVMFQVNNVMVSVGAKEITYFDADVGSICGSSASDKVDYLASLIHRTGALAAEMSQLLVKTTSQRQERAKFFTYKLMQMEQAPKDPDFLIRPSAVLRSAREHLRTYDSWKLMMRLRQILSSADEEKINNVIRGSTSWHGLPGVPPDAADLVVAAFQRWRSWDLEDPAESVLLKTIFGPIREPTTVRPDDFPMLGACRLAELQFILDPGPKENKISFVNLNARARKKMDQLTNSAITAGSKPETMVTIVNIFCGEASVNLNWEVFELVDDVLQLFKRNQSHQPAVPNSGKITKRRSFSSEPAFQVVVEVMRGSVEVETVNLKAQTLGDGLKASALMYAKSDRATCSSLMLNCSAVTSILYSHEQHLAVGQLLEPSVFMSHELQISDNGPMHIIKSSASSQELAFALEQDLLSLTELIDLVIRDEIAYIYNLKRNVHVSDKSSPTVRMKDRLSKFRLNIALFLDGYNISIPLFHTMNYRISGVVARAACAANFGEEFIFDFDVKENSHEIRVNIRNESQAICLLQIPPTNGRITSRMKQHENQVTILSSVEVVKLDASAVYNLLTAFGRPHILSAIKDLQQQANNIRLHFFDIFSPDQSSTPGEKGFSSETSLVYDAHLTFAGMQFLAKTSLNSERKPAAQVLFTLNKIHMHASNRHEADGPVLNYPDLFLNLSQIGLDICRGAGDNLKSSGSLKAGITISATSRCSDDGKDGWSFQFKSDMLDLSLSPLTVSTLMDVLGYMGEKFKDLDSQGDVGYLKRLKQTKPDAAKTDRQEALRGADILRKVLESVVYDFELRNLRFSWIVADSKARSADEEDLVLSIEFIDFGVHSKKSARLTIGNLRLQTVPLGQDKRLRSLHSAVLPEVMFNIAYKSTAETRRMAFQATGASLDLRLTSGFIVPAARLAESISVSMRNVRQASTQWNTGPIISKHVEEYSNTRRQNSIFGKKRFDSVLIDADFAGAVVCVSSKRDSVDTKTAKHGVRASLAGKYGQFTADDSGSAAVLRSPGLAWKAEYRDNGQEDPSLYGEIKIDASNNILYPTVVPLIMEIMSSVKEVVSGNDEDASVRRHRPSSALKPPKSGDEERILTADPSAVLGRVRLNLGLRICRQEFSLSCQPIARVAATTSFDNIYVMINTVASEDQGSFFAISGEFSKPQASVQHVYSRDSTGRFNIDSITLSLMNSKHVSGTSGVSAILNVSPMEVFVNAKQMQDFLLFREIWYPRDLRQSSSAPVAKPQMETSQGHMVQRYQQVAATAAFPWTATISIASLDVHVDFGQAIGSSLFKISQFWVSSKKTSDWEQNLCLGFDKIGISSTGRLSGSLSLEAFKLRTCIQWPKREEALNETPLVRASLGFQAFQLKAAFDYQAFLVADITSLKFLMYNVRESHDGCGDRLVATFDGEAVQVFGTTTSAAQTVALFQAFQKLVQERKENLMASLRDIEKFMNRKTSQRKAAQAVESTPKLPKGDTMSSSPISLDTDVVVNLKTLNLGVFPSTFSDNQVFKIEALGAFARFAASMEARRIHCILRMTLGQLQVGLAGVRSHEPSKSLSELAVEDVVGRATGSRGGTILKVPKVSATMETWQKPNDNHIDYLFKSAFEGKVEVGWNYSRISYIRGMLASHNKSLEQTWGRELPPSAVRITGVPEAAGSQQKTGDQGLQNQQQKITAEVNVPQSKYEYVAIETPVIETPQLRDMGEATPPLEWIGLHREKLPNLTHQIVIVSLLELAGEVEDAYARILGSS